MKHAFGNALFLLRSWWRIRWGLCPLCNMDAPEVDECLMCADFSREDWPPSKEQRQKWWDECKAGVRAHNATQRLVRESQATEQQQGGEKDE